MTIDPAVIRTSLKDAALVRRAVEAYLRHRIRSALTNQAARDRVKSTTP